MGSISFMKEDDNQQHKLKVVMFPWLAHGHISPFLEVAKRLTKRNFFIYFVSTPINIEFIKKTQLCEKTFPSIQLVELNLPDVSPDLPPHYHTTKSLPLHLMPTLKTALDMAKPTFSNLLKTLKPDLLIYDFIQPWAPDVAAEFRIPAVTFLITGGATSSFFYHCCKNPDGQFPFSAINLHEHEVKKTAELLSSVANGLTDRDRVVQSIDKSTSIVLAKTCRAVEAKYIDYYHLLTGKEMMGVGSLIREPTDVDEKSEFIEWLGKKKKGSSVFISFGTEYYLSKEELEELAYGLELSGVNFIWVIRFPEGEKNDEMCLPEGFKERVGEKGMVVIDGWVPQSRILAHPSIGGFVTHCGSGSVMEGMKFGVPLIAIPMHLDQPMNAKMVVEIGVGLEVSREAKTGRFARREVEKVIKQVVVEKEGEQLRVKAKEIGELLRNEGDGEINEVAQRLVELSNKQVEQTTPCERQDAAKPDEETKFEAEKTTPCERQDAAKPDEATQFEAEKTKFEAVEAKGITVSVV